MSNMLDIKDDPLKHAMVLIYSLKIEYFQNKIASLNRKQQVAGDDETFNEIFEYQKQLNEYKRKRNQVN